MPNNIRFSNPDTMQKPPGYSHVVEITGPGRTVYFAGRSSASIKSGRMGASAREQMEIAFENVKAALASVGASVEHRQTQQLCRRYRRQSRASPRGSGQTREHSSVSPPASTTVGVPQLARAGALFEVEAIAILPPK